MVYTQLNVKTVLLQTIQFSVSTVSLSKTVQFNRFQFSISTLFSFIWPIDRTLSGATLLGQSGPGSDGNKVVLHFLQSFSITRTSTSDCLVSLTWHSLAGGLIPYAVGVFYSQLGKCRKGWFAILLYIIPVVTFAINDRKIHYNNSYDTYAYHLIAFHSIEVKRSIYSCIFSFVDHWYGGNFKVFFLFLFLFPFQLSIVV